VPRAYGDENQSDIHLVGANEVSVKYRELRSKQLSHKFDYIEVESRLVPYLNPEEFAMRTGQESNEKQKYLCTNSEGKVEFSGKYGVDLMREIRDYAIVARTIAQENSFDVIHAHDWLAYPAGIEASEISGKPLVVHVHATDFDRSGGCVNQAVFAIEKEGMDAADMVITVSNLTRQIVIDKYGIPAEKVVTVYNAVEPIDENKEKLFKKGVDDKIVTFLGRITTQKGPEYFIEAAYRVLQKLKNVRFVMAGDGDMMGSMLRRAAELKIMDRFHFTGFLKGDEVFELLAMSDLYIMPSVSEPFGIVPLEAMQSNVPVLISRQTGAAEILTYAMKTDYWDVEAMADTIYGVLTYPGMSKMFVSCGKKEVDNLKWEHSALQVKRVYDKALRVS
jgi:glycosyltransferase involved in cell wall biosynthesis